jgi:hypothetical protein
LIPCPISEFGAMIVTAPLGAIPMNAFGAKVSAPSCGVSARAVEGPK